MLQSVCCKSEICTSGPPAISLSVDQCFMHKCRRYLIHKCRPWFAGSSCLRCSCSSSKFYFSLSSRLLRSHISTRPLYLVYSVWCSLWRDSRGTWREPWFVDSSVMPVDAMPSFSGRGLGPRCSMLIGISDSVGMLVRVHRSSPKTDNFGEL